MGNAGSNTDTGRRQRGTRIAAIVLATIGLLILLLGLLGVLVGRSPGEPQTDMFGAALVTAAFGAVFEFAAWRLWALWKPPRITAKMPHSDHTRYATPATMARRGRLSGVGFIAFMAVLGIGLTVLAVIGTADWRRSVATQHGPTVTATVQAMIKAGCRSECDDYDGASITYRPSVSGIGTATLRFSTVPKFGVGSKVQVRIDPGDPGYAELPGKPVTGLAFLIVYLGPAIFLGIPIVMGWRRFRLWRFHRWSARDQRRQEGCESSQPTAAVMTGSMPVDGLIDPETDWSGDSGPS